jgi:DNA helicase-2/ATP-dependent DNA helicase PcrA
MQLNEEQTAAVEHSIGEPACLIAGAGSGKTRVLTERVRWLIAQGVPAQRICAITFTNKAANELVERLGLEEASFDIPKVSTIHSLALGSIRRDSVGFGLQHKVTPLDDYDQTQMLRRIVEREVDIKEKGISLGSYVYNFLEKVGFHRSRGLGFSEEYTDDVHERALVEHAGYHALEPMDLKIWKAYEEEKKRNSVVDFDDMLHLVVRRLRTDPAYCAYMGKLYEHVLMDEAQDTNPVQWEFVNSLLSPTNKNFYVVGDMSQCIYAFNGAVPKILKDYSEEWRGHKPTLYRIARNHRSLPRIVYLANHIQSKMTATIPLKMQVFRGDAETKGTLEITKASLPLDVAMIIAGEIAKGNARKRDQIPYKENCILVRSARQVPDIESALVRHRIPYQVRGGRGLLQTEEIRDVLSYLRLATNPKDFTALARAVTVPKTGAGDVTLEKIRKTANEKFDGDLIQGCTSIDKLSTFVQALGYIQKFGEYPVQALDKIIDYMNYKTYVAAKYKKEPDKVKSKLENIERFRELVRNLSEDQKMSTEDLVFQLTLDRAREDDKDGMVTVSTIHSAKGLEWQRVFVTNVVEGSLPHRFSMGSEEEVEEERRLFYVACTRAKDALTLCVHAMEQFGSDTRRVAPSRFLVETGVIEVS